MITLYHGTDAMSASMILQEGIDLNKGRYYTDFGKGFYLTPSLPTARYWSKRKARNGLLGIVAMDFDNEAGAPWIKKFGDDLLWGQFVINNRNKMSYIKHMTLNDHNHDGRYKITYGRIADVDVTYVASILGNSNTALTDLLSILNMDYSFQYAFHSVDVLSFLSNFRLVR